MHLLFTDLDNTLLDHHTYSFEPARPVLDLLDREGIPWIPVTSKTRAELEPLRLRLHHHHPFIVENGGAAFLPTTQPGLYERLEFGTPYPILVKALRTAADQARCPVRGFADMGDEEVARVCNLPLPQANLAKQREYDEPFLVLNPSRAATLAEVVSRSGLRVAHGGRFHHILGANDKAAAVAALIARFPKPLTTIGLGDGPNDISFLELMDIPVLLPSPHLDQLRAALPHARLAPHPGPAGWAAAVQSILRP